jgi:hypothetical protein
MSAPYVEDEEDVMYRTTRGAARAGVVGGDTFLLATDRREKASTRLVVNIISRATKQYLPAHMLLSLQAEATQKRQTTRL